MARRILLLAGALAAVAGLCGPAQGKPKAPPKDKTLIVRYAGAGKGRAWGKHVMRIYVTMIGGKPKKMPLVVPNEPVASKKLSPNKVIAAYVKALDKGDAIKVTVAKQKGVLTVKKIVRYNLKPGEDDPSGYIFVDSEEDVVRARRLLFVTLMKFEQEIKARVATTKDEKGKEQTDPKLAAAVDKCKADQVVDVELKGSRRAPVIVYIGKFVAPVEGVFVKLVTRGKDPDKQTAVRVTVDGATKMFFLPTTRRGGKTRPDAKLLSAAKRLKPADLVQIKPRPGGKRLLAVRITKLKKKKDDE